MKTEPLPPFDLTTVVLDPALPLPDLLRSVERQIATAPVEIAFAFSADAELLVSKVGDTRRVRFSLAESHKMHDAFFTHNHPSGGF